MSKVEPGANDLDDMLRFMVQQLRSLRALPRDPALAEQASRYLTGNDRLLPVEQLEIYRVQFWLRHTSALLEDFPGVSGILGQSAWERLVETYLRDVPSGSFSLRDLGAGLPEYIAARSETPHHDLCSDMARLEWAYVEVFDAADAPALDGDKLRAIPDSAWESARLVTHPALRLLAARYPVAELRRKLRQAAREADGPAVAIPESEACYWALYRSCDRRLDYLRLGRAAFEVLTRLQQGLALVPACEQAAALEPALEREIEAGIGAWFADWGRRGFFVDVQTAPA